MTTSDYLDQLQTDKQTLVNNLVAKGVAASNDETFTTLAPKVAEIPVGNGDYTDYFKEGSATGTASITSKYIGNWSNYITRFPALNLRFNQYAGYFFTNFDGIEIDTSNFDTSNVTDMSGMFHSCSKLTILDLSSFNTTKVTKMSNMFLGCSKLTTINISNFDTSSVTKMDSMFSSCTSLANLDLSNFNTSKVTTMADMFSRSNNLSTIDISSFNTSNVTSIKNMFMNCSNLATVNLSNFDTTRVTDSSYMFQNCVSLTTVIINSPNVFKMTSATMFVGTPIASGTGYVYVPDDMVETYKTTDKWSTYAAQIKPLSELN